MNFLSEALATLKALATKMANDTKGLATPRLKTTA